MELLLQHGDHSRNGQGFLQEVDGAQQLVQRAMVRLTVPKGKFVLNPQLGSLLHTLGRTAPAQREQLAFGICAGGAAGNAGGAGRCSQVQARHAGGRAVGKV